MTEQKSRITDLRWSCAAKEQLVAATFSWLSGARATPIQGRNVIAIEEQVRSDAGQVKQGRIVVVEDENWYGNNAHQLGHELKALGSSNDI